MGRVCVSSCRCCVFASVVHPVAILSALFCVICSLLMLVSDARGNHMVETRVSGIAQIEDSGGPRPVESWSHCECDQYLTLYVGMLCSLVLHSVCVVSFPNWCR